MFADLTPPEQQRVAQNYMKTMGGRSQADIGKTLSLLASNEAHASRAMDMYNKSGVSDPDGRHANIDMLMANMGQQDGMGEAEVINAPVPPVRPANVTNSVPTPTPPTKPVELSGDDRVQAAGGPGSLKRDTTATAPNTQTAKEGSPSTTASIVSNVLAALGIGGTAYAGYKAMTAGGKKAESKQLPPEADAEPTGEPKRLTAPAPNNFDRAFSGDVEDAVYRDVPTTKQLPSTTKQLPPSNKQITGPDETAGRDNVKKAEESEVIEGKDGSMPPKRTAKTKATTVKEKLTPKVKVK